MAHQRSESVPGALLLMIVKPERLGANPPLTATERREALVQLWSIILEKELRADLKLEAKQTRDTRRS